VGGESADSSWSSALLGHYEAICKRRGRRRTGNTAVYYLHEPGEICTRKTRFMFRTKKCIIKIE
jgi:hypothetical protein